MEWNIATFSAGSRTLKRLVRGEIFGCARSQRRLAGVVVVTLLLITMPAGLEGARAEGMGPVFALPGGSALATRLDGTTFIVDTVNTFVPEVNGLRRELRTARIERGGTNASPFNVYSTLTEKRFPITSPAIAVNSSNAVVTYTDKAAVIVGEPDAYDIVYSLLDSEGAPTEPQAAAPETRAWSDGPVRSQIAMCSSGEFVLVWFNQDEGDLPRARARLFDSRGQPLGANAFFTVNQEHNAVHAVVGLADDGRSAYAWDDAGLFKYDFVPSRDIYARLMDSNGVPVGAEFRVNTTLDSYHSNPCLAMARNGSFAVAWQQSNSDADGIYLQRFASDGSRIGQELRVSPYNGVDAALAMSSEGRLAVAWRGGQHIFAQRLSADGSFLGSALWVDETMESSASGPLLGMDDSGLFLVKWSQGTNHLARWITWDAAGTNQVFGPRVQALFPDIPAPAGLSQVMVTLDRPMNRDTFNPGSVELTDPLGRHVPIDFVRTTNNQAFVVGFAPQNLGGKYHLKAGPAIQDTAGLAMDENGNGVNGETIATANDNGWFSDVYQGSFLVQPSAVAGFPVTEGFEAGPDSLGAWSFDTYGAGIITVTNAGNPHGGTNHLFFDTPQRDLASQHATLVVELSSQAGQTNLFLDFWARGWSRHFGDQGPLAVELSGEGQIWHPIFSPWLRGYTEYALDLDAAAATNGVALDQDVYIRFRQPSTGAGYIDGKGLFLDDVRIVAGDLRGPRVTRHEPANWGSGNSALSTLTVSFDKAIDPATFNGADVVLLDPQGTVVSPMAVTPVEGSGNTRFALNFPDWTIRGFYRLTVGPAIRDASGNAMNQDGNVSNGESGDVYTGTVEFPSTVWSGGTAPALYAESFEDWPLGEARWSFLTSGAGVILVTTNDSPHGGTNYLFFDTPPGETQWAMLVVDLSGQAGQTNLFLDFWARGWSRHFGDQGPLAVELSGEGQIWYPIFSPWLRGYTEYALDLDAAAATNGVALDQDVYLRFRQPKSDGSGASEMGLFLDDVRIVAGFPSRVVLGPCQLAQNGEFQWALSGPAGAEYVVEASIDLATWERISTNSVSSAGAITITDPFTTNYRQRFYRAVVVTPP